MMLAAQSRVADQVHQTYTSFVCYFHAVFKALYIRAGVWLQATVHAAYQIGCRIE